MKKLIIVLLIVLVAGGIYWKFFAGKSNGPEEAKVAPISVKSHSENFNNGIDSLMEAYFEIKDAFVDADTAKAKAATKLFIVLADSSRLFELKKDTNRVYESGVLMMNDIKLNAESLLQQHDITEMRQDFRMVGENIYPLLKTIHYEGKPLYLQNCPMAFGEDKGANWISKTFQVVNPYLGQNHPEFKGTMLHCGEVKDSVVAQ